MKVVHCDNCGLKIADDAAAASQGNDGKNYCAQCASLLKHSAKLPLDAQPSQANADAGNDPTAVALPVVREAAAEQKVMKFYFCETCGKRVTEADIEKGAGRNKKLKGVYCEDCAVGITTVQFEAIKYEPGKNMAILPGSGATSTAPTAGADARPSASPTKPGERSRVHSGKAAGAAGQQPLPLLAIAGALAAVVLVAVLALGRSGSRNDNSPAHSDAPTRVASSGPTPVAPRENTAAPLPPDSSRVVPANTPAESDAEMVAQADYAKVTKFDGLAEDDINGRIAVIEVFLGKHGGSSFAQPARALLDRLKRSLAEKPVSPAHDTAPAQPEKTETIGPDTPRSPAKQVTETEQPPQQKQQRPTETASPAPDAAGAKSALAQFQKDFLQLLSTRDVAAAAQRVARAESDAAFKNEAELLWQCRTMVGWLSDAEKAIAAGAEKLKDQPSFELPQTKGPPLRVGQREQFRATGFKDGAIEFSSGGVTLSANLTSFTRQALDKLALLGLGDDAAGLVRRTALTLLSANSPDAAAAIDRAQSAAISKEDLACLRTMARLAEVQQREAAAAAAFTELQKWSAAGDLKRLSTALANFKATFGSTTFAAEKSDELKAFEGPTQLNDGLVAYWKLDSIDKDQVEDASGNGNRAMTRGKLAVVPGKIGNALQFNGVDNWLKVARSDSLEPKHAITIALWACVGDARPVKYGDLLRKEARRQSGILFRWNNNDGRLGCYFHRNAGNIELVDTQPNSAYLNNWHHFAVTYDSVAGVARLYVDGCVRQTCSNLSGPLEHTDDLYMMYSPHPSEVAIPGKLDEVRVYKRALTESQIKFLADDKH